MTLTNDKNLSLPLAVLFSYSDYDLTKKEKTISTTTLIKPVRAIILGLLNPGLDASIDLTDLIPAVFGSAVHAFAESGWRDKKTLTKALKLCGVTEEQISKIVINPKTVNQGDIPIYIEKRFEREISGWTISGKIDGCIDGKSFDYKRCSVWAEILNSGSHDYILQGSINRWLKPDIILADHISIQKIFSDWSAIEAKKKKDYPQLQALSRDYQLMSLEDTELWIKTRLETINKHLVDPSLPLPRCQETSDELWASPSVFKVYKDDESTRAMNGGIHDTMEQARNFQSFRGGVVKEIKGKVKRCNYCSVAPICEQAIAYRASGMLD